MVVTLSGITIDARDVQPSKARPPMVVTLFGIIIDARDVHPRKAL
jgi:predicted alpha/beta-fold hydrolase